MFQIKSSTLYYVILHFNKLGIIVYTYYKCGLAPGSSISSQGTLSTRWSACLFRAARVAGGEEGEKRVWWRSVVPSSMVDSALLPLLLSSVPALVAEEEQDGAPVRGAISA